MKILAIDPGSTESAYCVIDADTYEPLSFGKQDNNWLLGFMDTQGALFGKVIIEMIASYGMAVGKEVFDTCEWYGRFVQLYCDTNENPKIEYVFRKDVKINLCNSMKAKDSNIRQSLIDRFGVVGIKKNQGWFYGFKKDIW